MINSEITKKVLDSREQHELNFCLTYHALFNHGAPGHNRMIVVSKLYHIILGIENGLTAEEIKEDINHVH